MQFSVDSYNYKELKMADPNAPKENKTDLKESMSGTLNNVKNFAQTNTWDTVGYVAMFLGLLLAIFDISYGFGLIGLVAGFYYSELILGILEGIKEWVDQAGIFKSFVGAGTLLGFFIASPSLIIGMAISVAVSFFMKPKADS